MKLFIDKSINGYRGYEILDDGQTDVSVKVIKMGFRFNVVVQFWDAEMDALPVWTYDGSICILSNKNGTSICGWGSQEIEHGEARFFHVPSMPERLCIDHKRIEIEYIEKEGKEIFAGV